MTQNQYRCELCGATFQGEAEFERHNRAVHSQFKCETCDQVLSSASELEEHTRAMHPEMEETRRS